MATLAAGASRAVNLAAFDILDFTSGTVTMKTAASYRVAIGDDYHQFTGTFVYDGLGALAGGTITQWRRIIDNVTIFTVTGLAYPVASFIAFRDSANSNGFLADVFAVADKMTGSTLADFLEGSGANESLSGGAANDTLVGDAGNDTLDGGTGGDSMVGGLGDDVYRVDNALDSVNELLDGGIDRVESTVAHTLSTDVDNLTLLGAAAIAGTGNDLANSILGNGGANLLTGNGGNDTLNGAGGNDTLNSGEGNDTLIGGVGIDSMVGGNGDDFYIVDNVNDSTVEFDGGGTDTVQSSVARTLGANLENLLLTGAGAIGGIGNGLANAITGNSGGNLLNGGAGSDTLTGAAGNDTLIGGDDPDTLSGGIGNDRYEVDAADSLSEAAGQGVDIAIVATGSLALGANFENLTLIGAAVNGTGNDLNNTILGNGGANDLDGGFGNDTLDGAAGNDTLRGGLGLDKMTGGLGNDTFYVDNVGDKVADGANQGADLVVSTISYLLVGNVENLTLDGADPINGTGNTLNNALTGNDAVNRLDGSSGNDSLNGVGANDTLIGGVGNDTLIGGTGADSMTGGTGDDTYQVDDPGDVIVELANQGNDTVQILVSHTLAGNIENLVLIGSADTTGTGSAGNNVIVGNSGANLLDGAEGNDNLNGAAGSDTVRGGLGDDTLTGGSETDTLEGGDGNDTYIVDSIDDTIVEAATLNSGTDIVNSSAAAYTLATNVENLLLLAPAIAGTGNTGGNLITGNASGNLLDGADGNDTLDGGLGNDTLIGGPGADRLIGAAGDDLYFIDSAGDEAVEAPGAGFDEVRSSVSHALALNIENLTLIGGAAINGVGNASNNLITGNDAGNSLIGDPGNDTLVGAGGDDTLIGGSGNDSLVGGADNDTLIGGLGDDIYTVEDGGDTILENENEGNDELRSVFSVVLSGNIERLTLLGSGANSGTGNAVANAITGNEAANALIGGAGNDTINGAGGNDTIDGGEDNDNLAGGADDDLIDGGNGNDTLDGGLGTNTLRGGLGDDVYVIHAAGTTVTELSGAGIDTINTAISLVLPDNVEHLNLFGVDPISGTGNLFANRINGTASANTLAGGIENDTLDGAAGDDSLLGEIGADSLIGGEGNDTLNGGLDVDRLDGGNGNDSLIGDIGNDTLVGGAGNDTLDGGVNDDSAAGGLGDDVYIVGSSTDIVTELKTQGFDEVQSTASSFVLSAEIEKLTIIGGGLNGTGNTLANLITGNDFGNNLAGSSGNDTLNGAGGGDTLNGGTGVDVMVGGAGDDVYIVDSPLDSITELAGGGVDRVETTLTHTLGDTFEDLTLLGFGAIHGTGNGLDNEIIGGGGANRLTGNGGNDSMTGFNGNDTLLGGDGNDTLFGGFGADSMVGGSGSDTFHYGAITDGGDRIVDFTTGAGGDTLDVADLLIGFGPASDVNAFVRCIASGANTIVQVDANGAVGGATFTSICTLVGVATTANALDSGGNLVVD